MDKKILLIGLLAVMLFVSGCSQSENYVIEGNSVLVDDELVSIRTTPHTIQGSGWVETEFTSKQYSGDIDFAFGFDTDNVRPTALQIYRPTETTHEDSYTCGPGYEYNYTVDPNYLICYEEYIANSTTYTRVLWEGPWDRGNLQERTVYWNYTITQDWVDWNPTDHTSFEFDGLTDWWYATDQHVNAGQNYKIRYYLDIPWDSKSGKYGLALKPSSKTFSQALADDQLYYLDPWWGINWNWKRLINVTSSDSATDYATKIRIPYDGNMTADFSDLRFIASDDATALDYWIEDYYNESYADVWVEVDTINANSYIYMYYGNAAASTTSSGTDTFLIFEDFEDDTLAAHPSTFTELAVYTSPINVLNSMGSQALVFDNTADDTWAFLTHDTAVPDDLQYSMDWQNMYGGPNPNTGGMSGLIRNPDGDDGYATWWNTEQTGTDDIRPHEFSAGAIDDAHAGSYEDLDITNGETGTTVGKMVGTTFTYGGYLPGSTSVMTGSATTVDASSTQHRATKWTTSSPGILRSVSFRPSDTSYDDNILNVSLWTDSSGPGTVLLSKLVPVDEYRVPHWSKVDFTEFQYNLTDSTTYWFSFAPVAGRIDFQDADFANGGAYNTGPGTSWNVVSTNGVAMVVDYGEKNETSVTGSYVDSSFATGAEFALVNYLETGGVGRDVAVDNIRVWKAITNEPVYIINEAQSSGSTIDVHAWDPSTAYVNTTDLICRLNATSTGGGFTNMTIQVYKNDVIDGAYNTLGENIPDGGGIVSPAITGHVEGDVFICEVNVSESGQESSMSNQTITISNLAPYWYAESEDVFQDNYELVEWTHAGCSELDVADTVTYGLVALGDEIPSGALTINSGDGSISHTVEYNDTGSFLYNVTCNDGTAEDVLALNMTLNQTVWFADTTLAGPFGEGDSINFGFDINSTIKTYSNSSLMLNGSLVSTDDLAHTLDTTGWGNSTGITYYYNWTFPFTSVENVSTGDLNFTVYSMEVDNCTLYTYPILNWTLNDEETTELVSIAGANVTNIEIDLGIENLAQTISWNYSTIWTNKNEGAICVPENILNNTNYTIDVVLEYSSTDHVTEFFYLDNGTLSTNGQFNSYTDNTWDLMNLKTADSTTFLFNYFDETGLPVDNALVVTYRKYIGEGLFREVERSKQDDAGDTHIHLVEEDVIYYFVITKQGEVLYTTTTSQARCLDVPCLLEVEASGDFSEFSDDYDLMTDGSYSLTYDESARTTSLTFALDTVQDMNLTIYKYSNNEDELEVVASDTVNSGSGTLVSNIPLVAGNTTFIAAVYNDGEFVRSYWVDFNEDSTSIFGDTFGIFLTALMVIVLGLMAISEGIAFIVFILLALIIAGGLRLADFGWVSLISLICAGAIIIGGLLRRRK